MSETTELRALGEISNSLWGNPASSRKAAVETIMATSLMDLSFDRTVLRAATALLERASRESPASNAELLNNPFYRLSPSERFAVTAVHKGGWDYERIARVLKIQEKEVAPLIWKARFYLAAANQKRIPQPNVNPRQNVNCPEYVASNPWTQRFMDEEVSPQQQLYFQNHMMACEKCRETLNRYRDLFYVVDGMIPSPEDKELNQTVDQLKRAWQETQNLLHPSLSMTFLGSLSTFFKRKDAQIAAAIAVLLFIMMW